MDIRLLPFRRFEPVLVESIEEETTGDWGRRNVESAFPSELGRENATLLRGLLTGEAMGEAPGMRWTSDSYLYFSTWLSSCRDLTNCEVNPKPAWMHPALVTTDHFGERGKMTGDKLRTEKGEAQGH